MGTGCDFEGKPPRTPSCSVPGPRAYSPTRQRGGDSRKRHTWSRSIFQASAAPQRKDALMSPRAMGDFIVRAADSFGLDHPHIVGRTLAQRQRCSPRPRNRVASSAGLWAPAVRPFRFNLEILCANGFCVGPGTLSAARGRPIVGRFALSDTAREGYLVSYQGDRFAESIPYVQSYRTDL